MKSLFQKPNKIILLLCAVSYACPPSWSQTRQFQFEQFPVEVYKGNIRIPKWLHMEKDGEWTYITSRSASPPEGTFAGEYDLDGLTCGTECHFYEMTSLRTGVDVREISIFDSAEPLPKTKGWHPYLTELFYQPDSRLLIVQYYLDLDNPNKHESCRQRYYILENGKLRPISKTFLFCTERDEP